jgi:hypothetical protein
VDWMGGATCPPPMGEQVLVDFFRVSPHRLAVQTLDYSLFVRPIPFVGRPFPLHDAMAVCSPLGALWFGRVWLRLIDVAEAAGVPDCEKARDFINEQKMSVAVVTVKKEQPKKK